MPQINNSDHISSVSALSKTNRTTVLTRLALFAALLVGVTLRFRSIWAMHLWGDEVFTFSLSQGTWLTLMKRAALDMVHPPLFYFLLKPWIYIVGSSIVKLRVLNVAISVATFAPFIALGRQLKLREPAIALAVTLMAVNSYLILYSYYLRSYSLLLFLTLCSHLFFVKLLDDEEAHEKRTFVLLVVINILLVYTHYFGWLAFGAQFLWVAATNRRHLGQMLKAAIILIISYLPWLAIIIYTLTRVTYTFWDQIRDKELPESSMLDRLLRSFNCGFSTAWITIAGSIVFTLLILVSLKYAAQNEPRQDDNSRTSASSLPLLAVLCAFPVVVSVLAASLLNLVWEPRYVIVSIGPYLLLLSASAFSLRQTWVRAVLVAGILTWAVIANSTGDMATTLHGPNGISCDLAIELSHKEVSPAGPVPVYGLSPYAEQGLRLALGLIGEGRFQLRSQAVNDPLPGNYFWLAVTEHDPLAAVRVRELRSDPRYIFGEPLYAGTAPQRHMLFPVQHIESGK